MIFHRDENTERFGLFSNSINTDRLFMIIGFTIVIGALVFVLGCTSALVI